MSAAEKSTACKDVAPLLVFYACNEVSEQERQQIEAHLAHCAACSQQIIRECKLAEVLAAAPQAANQLDPAGILLARCRSELAETLDDLSAPPLHEHWRPFGWLRRWMALRPAWSGVVLILFGVLLGAQIVPWMQSLTNDDTHGNAVNVKASPKLSDDQLSKMAIAGINLSGSSDAAPASVQLHVRAEEPIILSGNADDSEMRRVLTYIIESGDRFDAGVRLDCLDALKARARDLEVRRALLSAARKDQNPAVRMKALESLHDLVTDNAVRDALLDALEHDGNPGVRVEAVNILVRSLEHKVSDEVPIANIDASDISDRPDIPSEDSSVERVVRTLAELQKRDPSRYVRLRTAAALRQIGPRESQ
ncbi:MAG TPA: HEAT repeat domain-containing protein [Candidatus Dormibacteraeota bacterium]|nr:HEAT repeat domain-containing protein [Candidatus Dormibacteraeota bacterium]